MSRAAGRPVRAAGPPRPQPRSPRGEQGSGLIAASSGVVVFLVFLLFSVQLLFGLYAATVVTAVANDAARRAAAVGAPPRELIQAEAARALGAMGERATLAWADEDSDGDGALDTVALTVVASPPRFIPPSIGGRVGLGQIERTARARAEGFR